MITELNFSLSERELHLILNHLGKMPYEIVFEVIAKLQAQALAQLQQSENF